MAELEAGPKAPHERAVRVVFDETLRPGDEQVAVEQRGIAKDRLRANRFDVSRQRTIERADGRADAGCRFAAIARLADGMARFPGKECRNQKEGDGRANEYTRSCKVHQVRLPTIRDETRPSCNDVTARRVPSKESGWGTHRIMAREVAGVLFGLAHRGGDRADRDERPGWRTNSA